MLFIRTKSNLLEFLAGILAVLRYFVIYYTFQEERGTSQFVRMSQGVSVGLQMFYLFRIICQNR